MNTIAVICWSPCQ